MDKKKRKKPAFGFFDTLNPDAGDVEKGIEFFNNSTVTDTGSMGMAEAFKMLESVDETHFDKIPLEDIREGSIGNMSDEDIDYQEKTFSNLVRKLKADERQVVAIKYDSGYYDYDPEYVAKDADVFDGKYGEFYRWNDLTFFKEKKYPFLFFRNEADADRYIEMYEEVMENDI